MRRRPLLWLAISLACFAAAVYFWNLGNKWAGRSAAPATTPVQTNQARGFPLTSRTGNLNAASTPDPVLSPTNRALRFAYRLSNTQAKIGELTRTPTAVLLENALIDTRANLDLPFPAHLRASDEPGAWIVQAKGQTTPEFRSMLTAAGAQIVSYIPNNAYLVTGSKAVADSLHGKAQAVLAYEPYYKLKSSLLRSAAQMELLPKNTLLRVLLFPGETTPTINALAGMGSEIVDETRSPFGPIVTVRPQPNALPGIARIPGVQVVELARERIPANDRSRVAIAISTNTVTTENHFGLTGANVLVNVNDTGIDASHPDLAGRVIPDPFWTDPGFLVDSNGHGTHVAGIIAGSGINSTTITNPAGSVTPVVASQFRGKAPGAKLFSMPFFAPDVYLQETAARTNAFVSNNSWQYRSAYEYDLAAASYDAAVRDALPTETGSQPLLFVFPAGNSGGNSSASATGNADSIVSPGTAKNVITVGAVEQLRGITNEVWECYDFQGQVGCQTNRPWAGETDTEDEVAGYSSRGNVGISIEGEDGRFKPDLVAPGAMVISTRSASWDVDTYYNKTNRESRTFSELVVEPGGLWGNGLRVPVNAVELRLSIGPGIDGFVPNLPIYVRQSTPPTNSPGGYDVMGMNEVVLPRDYPLVPDSNYYYAVGNDSSNLVSFSITQTLATTNSSNYEEVLKGLNDQLGPFYRYESGSSMAAAQVAGTLALMQEFFEQRLGRTNSPALMKALLINGSRPINNDLYDLHPNTELNSQGWGIANITNILHGALADSAATNTSSLLYFDQNPDTALATGTSHTYPLVVNPDGEPDSIRITLVWTDPPGNPAASIKLVNDLDLIVTNLDTGDVYFGNDIPKQSIFNLPWDTNLPPVIDVVNNVENVYLPGYTGTNLSVTVLGSHINVNAVSAHTNDVVQDYALVISCGNGYATNGITLGARNTISQTTPYVTVVTNAFEGNPDYSGNVLYGQHAGASTPLLGTNQIAAPVANGVITLGMTNQWHFYAISNIFGFTNAAFMTFIPPNLAVPRMGATETEVENASRVEADIDMYVSTDPALTNLDPAVVSQSIKSLGRNGTETIILNDAVPGVYYIGVKAEDQQAAEYVFAGVFSRYPFSEEDALGNQYVRGFPVPQAIPDAFLNTAGKLVAGVARILAFSVGPDLVRRVIVTNSVAHELIGDLTGTLRHGRDAATLNNITATNVPAPPIYDMVDGYGVRWPAYIYDDSGENNVPYAHQSDGPGTLEVFGGKEGSGQWIFSQSDGAVTQTGTNGPFRMFIERQPDLEDGIIVTIEPGACRTDYVRVPAEATNLTIEVTMLAGTGPVSVRVCPLDNPLGCESTEITNGIGGSVTIDILDDPPLSQGVYSVRTCNLGADQVTVRIVARIYRGALLRETLSNSSGPVDLKDDAITYAYITNLNGMRISSLDVGLMFNHPRISDMAITLISPNGTRILLFEDRGGLTTTGMGNVTATTNGLGEVTYYYTTLKPFYTNSFDASTIGLYAPGASFEGWDVLTNYATVLQDWSLPWLSNNVLSLEDSTVQLDLPTTNSPVYNLSFRASHAPYIAGTVGWWPFEGDGQDIFGGLNGLLLGGGNTTNFTMFSRGRVHNAFYGDAVRTSVRVPAAPELNVGTNGFTVEGWIYPVPRSTNNVEAGTVALAEGFEAFPANTLYSITNIGGWALTAGSIDVRSTYFGSSPHSGQRYIDINGWQPATLSTNLTLVPNQPYTLSLAFARNPDSVQVSEYPVAAVDIGGFDIVTLAPSASNSWSALGWNTTSIVFTVSAPSTTLTLRGVSPGPRGVLLDSLSIEARGPTPDTAPLFEWVERSNNVPGVQFWISGLSWTNPQPGALVAAFGTNGTQVITTPTNILTGKRWQHVALTYDAAFRQARVYVNGQVAAANAVPAGIDPVTSGDLFFGFHPANSTNVASFKGGIDEFGLYRRPLTDCEVNAIYTAGSGGKYGTNALRCPVAFEVTVNTDTTSVYTITNGYSWWTNGPAWEWNSIDFTNPILTADTNSPGTNLAGITIRPLTPNVALDAFVLSGLVSNKISGVMQFTENTNTALVPIKFAPAPYSVSNFPPTAVFTNNFTSATQSLYAAGATIPGMDPLIGRDWLVATGSVAVISDRLLNEANTNSLVLGQGTVQSTLPTIPGHRYELTYRVRGPGAVSWWNGDLNPLSGRARDLIGGNDAALINGATNAETGFILQPNTPDTALVFRLPEPDGTNESPSLALSPRAELSDPENLRLTNALTIESWVYPRPPETDGRSGLQQIFYRGDGRDCLDPYYLALYYNQPSSSYDIVFHVEDASGRNCGHDLWSTNQPVNAGAWQHIAAVFESNVAVPGIPHLTNQVSIYLNGQRIAASYTRHAPFAELDPSFTPGASIGNRSRYSRSSGGFTDAQPFSGSIDDLTVYGRALTDAEISGIYAMSALGKTDPTVPGSQAFAKVQVAVDGVQLETANGENGRFTPRTVYFTAAGTNATVQFKGLLPGTIIDGLHLTDVPAALSYLPEENLSALIGENSYGIWTLEMWDTRGGGFGTNDTLKLLDWRLDFQLAPTNPLPVITLQHGIPYEGFLLANNVQHFVVPVPQWATNATNTLLWTVNRVTGTPGEAGVLFSATNQAPSDVADALIWPPASSGTVVLGTNTVPQFIIPGQNYYLTVTNPGSQPISFSFGVTFDIESLTNCLPTEALANRAGIPKYFQFDVPADTNGASRQVVISLTGAEADFTLVASQNLPLPDLARYDYISRQPSTRGEMVMVLTNTTPYPLTQGHWYAAVYSSAPTNMPFTIQVCQSADPAITPRIIPLTNDVPFVASRDGDFAAPPGPPRWMFYEFDVTNMVHGILFELYGLTGDADMIVQREVPSGMAPYFDGSFKLGRDPESVVVRIGKELADLRGKWYVGVYNNESTNVGYTVEASVTDASGRLNTALPLMITIVHAAGPHGVILEWNSIPGEVYIIEHAPNGFPPIWEPLATAQPIVATTTLTAVELPIGASGSDYYRIWHVARSAALVPPMSIRLQPDGQVRVSWPTSFGQFVVQSTTDLSSGLWLNTNVEIVQEGSEFAFYFPVGPGQRFFRLVP